MHRSTLVNQKSLKNLIQNVNISVALINIMAFFLGLIALSLILGLKKASTLSFLKDYTLYVIFAVTTGFFDWILYNLVVLLVPQISFVTVEWIYHIFWDLIGFPTALVAFYFILSAISKLVGFHIKENTKKYFVLTISFLWILSSISLFLRLQGLPVHFYSYLWNIFFYVVPILQICLFVAGYFKANKSLQNDAWSKKFLIISLAGYVVWVVLSFIPFQPVLWRHLIIFSFYLALLLPAVYLHFNIKFIPAENMRSIKDLSAREKEVVTLLLEGKTNQEISDQLFVSLQTVKNYISKIYKRFGIKNRVEFVNLINKSGGEPPSE